MLTLRQQNCRLYQALGVEIANLVYIIFGYLRYQVSIDTFRILVSDHDFY